MKDSTPPTDQPEADNAASAGCMARLVRPLLFIVNVYDRPSELFIAERRKDGKYYYVHPDLRREKRYWGMEPENPTPLERFGIEVEIKDGNLHGKKVAKSEAEYTDGRRRLWQGSPEFSFSLPNNQAER